MISKLVTLFTIAANFVTRRYLVHVERRCYRDLMNALDMFVLREIVTYIYLPPIS